MAAFPQGNQLLSPLVNRAHSPLSPQDSRARSPLSPQDSRLASPVPSRARSQLHTRQDNPLVSRLANPVPSRARSQLDSHLIGQLDGQQGSRVRSQVHTLQGSLLHGQLLSPRSLLGNLVHSHLASQQRIQHFTKFQAKLMSMATTRHRIGAAKRRCGSALGPTLMTRRPSFLFFFGEPAGREATNSM